MTTKPTPADRAADQRAAEAAGTPPRVDASDQIEGSDAAGKADQLLPTVVATDDRPGFVAEGTRQELLGGGRAFDYATGRELTLVGETDVRFATEAEIKERGGPAGSVATHDVASLNPT
jgi:hypothetical protein